MRADEDRIQLEIMGISYNPLKSGAFALLLAQVDGPYRIPIMIGALEAQSIAIKIEGVITPRPVTHDVITSLMHGFGIVLKEVFIYKFEDGIFFSELIFTDGIQEVVLESRTSDAIAIAIRTGAPIFTTPEILSTTGAIFESEPSEKGEEGEEYEENDFNDTAVDETAVYENMTTGQLNDLLATLISDENYEEAARVSKIIKERDGNQAD